jgi:hypothetical protein
MCIIRYPYAIFRLHRSQNKFVLITVFVMLLLKLIPAFLEYFFMKMHNKNFVLKVMAYKSL